jgi:hypothetical protein
MLFNVMTFNKRLVIVARHRSKEAVKDDKGHFASDPSHHLFFNEGVHYECKTKVVNVSI